MPQCACGNLGFFHTIDELCPRRTLFFSFFFFFPLSPSCIRCGFAWCRFSSTTRHLKLSKVFLSSVGGGEAGSGLRPTTVDLNLLGSFREPGLCACVYMYISVSKTSIVSLRELGEKTCTVSFSCFNKIGNSCTSYPF